MERRIETLWCDDVRQEVGGKLSFIGVYTGGMIIPTFPITLPKLCLVLRMVIPIDRPLQSASLKVLIDEYVLFDTAMPEEMRENLNAIKGSPDGDAENQARVLFNSFVLSPLKLEHPCVLRVRVQTESEELRGFGLTISAGSI